MRPPSLRILVTGGAGFIGSHTVERLLERGHEPIVLDDLSTGRLANLPPEISVVHASILDRDAVWAALEGCDAVLHLAAVVSVPRSVENPLVTNAVNLTGTLNVLEAARTCGVGRVVLASSAAVYGDLEPPLPEDSWLRPLSPYALEKASGEEYGRLFTRLFDLRVVSLRYFNVYGPRQDPASPYSGVLSRFADALTSGVPVEIHGDGEQTRDFVFVRDVAEANALALEQAESLAGSVFNIGTGAPTSVNAAYHQMARILGESQQPRRGPARVGDVPHSLAVVERARSWLGWEAGTNFVDGIRATLEAFAGVGAV